MRRVHPLWRGFFAAAALSSVAIVLLNAPDSQAVPALAAGSALGALTASLPGRIARRDQQTARPGLRRLAVCFLAGMLLQLSLALLGTTSLLPALLTGSVGAAGAAAAALLTGLTLLRLLAVRERRRSA